MNNKIKLFCILSSLIIFCTCLHPTVSAEEKIIVNKKIKIEICSYNGIFNDKKTKEMTIEQAFELKQILLNLDEAIEKNDIESINYFQRVLTKKDIIKPKHAKYLSGDLKNEGNNSYNISNKACFFKSVGRGIVAFPIEKKVLQWIIDEASEEGGLGGIILAILLIILFYVPVMLITHLIPLRLASPSISLELHDGTMRSVGTKGNKRIEIDSSMTPARVNLSFFSGITIGFPDFNVENETENNMDSSILKTDNPDGGFLFIFGFAGEVKEIKTEI